MNHLKEMTMKTLVEIMAQSVGARLQQNKNCNVEYLMSSEALEAFAELARADARNATLEEIATKIGKMPFGDTAASFAVWIREQKT